MTFYVTHLRPALPEKPKLSEIIRNDLCSYFSSDIPRVSYFHPQNISDPAPFISPIQCLFQANYQDFLFFALSQDFGPIKNLLLSCCVHTDPRGSKSVSFLPGSMRAKVIR